jgi:hypothetical protein
MTKYLVTAIGLVALSGTAMAQTFEKVDVYVQEDGKEKKRDARLEVDIAAAELRLVDEKKGAEKATYAVVPFDTISAITYENAAGISKTRVLAFGVLGLFSKSKKHWLTIDTSAVPEGYVYMRLDKKNYQQVRRAVQAATDVSVSIVTE